MAAGDVQVQILDATVADISGAAFAMRAIAGANGHYAITSVGPENQQVVLVAIEEA